MSFFVPKKKKQNEKDWITRNVTVITVFNLQLQYVNTVDLHSNISTVGDER